ncbi:class I SAM-dependent methyltransferase [Enorma phocaeensis]|uniref:class I SAM-dependent methyltransferase n=1 Tax=Enorma phocaeensis TaxID=1871019 RepID=UPI00195B24D7|nr:class I SAM-dependent methyltransferase [Enorma phocaeensis]MBM6953881.1 class I SAM-dependent methyltransferase [Enorma phocaeensis]
MAASTATLLTTDWNEEWKALQAMRRRPDDPSFWNARAKHFKPRETHPYARDFMALVEARPGESVLDMGCGAGSLAIPFARNGHPVLACDFSPRMLDVLDEGVRHFGLQDLVQTRCLAWDEDWDEAGMEPKCVDIAIASRSIATADLAEALLKLDQAARRRCCITLVANASPRVDRHIMDAIGASVTESRDYVYAFNILVGLGACPEVRYIESWRRDTFDSLEAGVSDFTRMLEGGNEDRLPELKRYIEQHMIENPRAGEPGEKGRPEGRYMLDHQRVVRWAFIAWSPLSNTRAR